MKDLASKFSGVKTVAIAGHERPDGDCVGSCLAVYNYIKTYFPAITADLYLEPIPNIFKFLKNSDKIKSEYPKMPEYDLFIALDCGDTARLGKASVYFEEAKKTICVDHHISNASFADDNYIFPKASSTSELIFELLEEEKITKEIAECIYVGIVHDTGVFQYSCTSAKTMDIAGKLMEMGIDFSAIVDKTFYEKTYSQNRIMGKALMDSELLLDGKVIFSVVTAEDMREFGVLPKHLDGIVNQLRVTKDVEVAVFLYETGDRGIKVSMRSNGKVDVATIAVGHGGGGHVRAAGVTMVNSVEEIREILLSEIAAQLGM
ncbi:MAG: DHH family phosphoesterase [Lachnospiraceae bacterium]|nr:DHH family phosphoesterase [Lachnospiraceae bacterium]